MFRRRGLLNRHVFILTTGGAALTGLSFRALKPVLL